MTEIEFSALMVSRVCHDLVGPLGAVINGQLYLIMFDAARSHYYEAALPDFEAVVASAQLHS